MKQMELLIDAKNALGECVIWCGRQQRLFWTDILGKRLFSHQPDTGETRQWNMPEALASFALTEDDDRLLLGLASQLAYFQFSTGQITPVCPVESDLPSTRINDGRCDRQGRFVFGSFNQAEDGAAIGSFYRLNLDLSLERLPLQKVSVANSIGFSPDGGTMYYCDSPEKMIRCCSYDQASGAISQERVFVDLRDQPGEPDGSAIDADGYLWNAQWRGGRIVRFAPDGRLDRILHVPASQATCVAFGGADLHNLFASSARILLTDSELAAQPQAGGVFHAMIDDVSGMPEQRFLGDFV